MPELEKEVEQEFKELIRSLGGISYKWVSPGRRGIPDRLVFIRGKVYAVELKKIDGKTSPLQRLIHRELARHEIQVCVVYGKAGVKKLGGYLYVCKQQAATNQRDQRFEGKTKTIKVFR